eukprot:1329315-Amorphochlora_amoeboformis.AAC.1
MGPALVLCFLGVFADQKSNNTRGLIKNPRENDRCFGRRAVEIGADVSEGAFVGSARSSVEHCRYPIRFSTSGFPNVLNNPTMSAHIGMIDCAEISPKNGLQALYRNFTHTPTSDANPDPSPDGILTLILNLPLALTRLSLAPGTAWVPPLSVGGREYRCRRGS